MSFVTEQACLCFEITRADQPFGIEIAGGLDQDASRNPFAPGDTGIFILSVEPLSLAHNAGLKVGDKILQANGYDFTMVTLKQAERRIQRKDTLRLKITRDGLTVPGRNWGSSNKL